MGQPYVGEIRMFGGNFAPAGWMTCDGQLLPISEYETLFNLIGTTYGGDGTSTFELPNLQGCLPLHQGTGPGGVTFTIGQTAGSETVTLTTQMIPTHNHPLNATDSGPQAGPAGANPAVASTAQPGTMVYGAPATQPTTLHPNTIQMDGNNTPHNNIQPYQCINFIISLFGIYPSPT